MQIRILLFFSVFPMFASPAQAVSPPSTPVISTAVADTDAGTLLLRGFNFPVSPKVYMGKDGKGMDLLPVLDSSPTMINTVLKTTAPGTYLVAVLDQGVDTTELSTMSLTIGATGPSGPSGGEFSGGDQEKVLATTVQIVRTISVTVPEDGYIITFASGHFDFNGVPGLARCSINTIGTLIDYDHLIIAEQQSDRYLPFAATRGFAVTAGRKTIYLVCDKATGTIDVSDTSLTAIFFKDRL